MEPPPQLPTAKSTSTSPNESERPKLGIFAPTAQEVQAWGVLSESEAAAASKAFVEASEAFRAAQEYAHLALAFSDTGLSRLRLASLLLSRRRGGPGTGDGSQASASKAPTAAINADGDEHRSLLWLREPSRAVPAIADRPGRAAAGKTQQTVPFQLDPIMHLPNSIHLAVGEYGTSST